MVILFDQGFPRPILLTKHPKCSEGCFVAGIMGQKAVKNIILLRNSYIYQKILKGKLILCFYSFFWFPFWRSFLSFRLFSFIPFFSFLSFPIFSPFLIFPLSLDCLFPGMFPLLSGNMKIHTTIKIFFKKFFLLFASFSQG